MMHDSEQDNVFEILISDVGEMRVVLRPELPFVTEGYRLRDGKIDLFGQGERVSFSLSGETFAEAMDLEQALLLEFARNGSDPVRETELIRQ
ncbi:MAG: hypothetical protein CMO01_00400 [Thalassobius sp.]|nr:hypothetical protein [Thalassovita sp.]